MKKIICLRGLPASGKSSWAKEQLALDPIGRHTQRVNKDDIRIELHNGQWSRENEKEVVATERSRVGKMVYGCIPIIIVDNTHLWEDSEHIQFYRNLAELHCYEFEIKDFDTPVHECIARDAKREKPVGSKVIWDMYTKFVDVSPARTPYRVQDTSLLPAYIFDIDGTLAIMNGRSPYDYSRVIEDLPNEPVIYLNRRLAVKHNNIIVSGRPDSCRKETEEWLNKNWIFWTELHMRKTWDDRNDAIIKREIAEELILPKYYVLGVFDDRDRVVKMFRELWLLVCQVFYWKF